MEAVGLTQRHTRQIVAILCLAVLTFFYVGMQPGGDLMVAARKRELPVYNVARDEKVLSISFDAAWGSAHTLGILDILDQFDVKTTFFLVGIWVEKYPDLLKEIVARGHEIGSHSTSHPHMSQLSETKMREELRTVGSMIESITGTRPTLFRPPYGDYNDTVVLTVRSEGYECVQWNVDSLDWKNRGAQDMIHQCTKAVNPGDIVLFHNDSQYILDALPTILKHYQDLGYSVIPVSQILLSGETTIDHAGTQHQKAPAQESVTST